MATRAGVGECSTSPTPHLSSARSIRASVDDRILGGESFDGCIDRVTMRDDRPDELAGERRGRLVALVSRRGGARGPRRRSAGRSRPRRRSRGRGGGRSGRRGPYRQPTRGSPRGQPPTPSTVTVTESSWRPSRRSTVAPTADRTWRVSGTSAWPGRATIETSTWTPVAGGADRRPRVRRGASARPGRRGRRGGRPGPRTRRAGPSRASTPLPTVSSGPLTRPTPGDGSSERVCRSASGAARGAPGRRRERLGDELRDAGPGHRRRDVDAERDHPPPGPAVGDDHGAAHAEERRPAGALVVEDVADPADPGPQQQVRDPAPERAPELAPEQVEDPARQALEELDDDVAQDRVADDDVGEVVDDVLALDVADEVEVRLVEQLGRLLDPGVALALLLADREQRDARVRRRRARGRRRSTPSARTGRGSRRSNRGSRRCRGARAAPRRSTSGRRGQAGRHRAVGRAGARRRPSRPRCGRR